MTLILRTKTDEAADKKGKGKSTAEPEGEGEAEAEAEAEPEEDDLDNLIVSGKRNRKKVDYSKVR